MRTLTQGTAVAAFLVFVFLAPVQAAGLDEWAKAKEVRGSFGVLVGGASSDPQAAALIHTELKGFILQGTATLLRVKADANSILFRGPAKGILFMQHKAAVAGGQAAASEQLCSGAFDKGEFLFEIFREDREYQVQFSGEVPGCEVTTRRPAFELMTRIFARWHDDYRKLGDEWAPLADELKRAHDEFASFSAKEKKQEAVTFSATAQPVFKKSPGSRFAVMHFFPLPAAGPVLAGTGSVQLVISTSLFPTTITTEASWALQAVP